MGLQNADFRLRNIQRVIEKVVFHRLVKNIQMQGAQNHAEWRRTLWYVAMTRDERNAADAVPVQAGISVLQQPVR